MAMLYFVPFSPTPSPSISDVRSFARFPTAVEGKRKKGEKGKWKEKREEKERKRDLIGEKEKYGASIKRKEA